MYSIEQRDEQLRGTTAAITYTLGFDRAAQHLITVRMRIDSVTGSSVTVVQDIKATSLHGSVPVLPASAQHRTGETKPHS